jgi:lipopolysaccharide export system permease protein
MGLKIKNRYLGSEFMLNFLFSLAVFSFVFSLQAVFQIIEFLVKGTFFPMLVAGIFFLSLLSAFVYIIPLSFFYSSTALFSRLSADREILILSAAGISPRKLVRIMIPFTVFAVLLFFVFNLLLLPEISYKRRGMVDSVKFKNPLSLLQERNIVTAIPGITLYVEKISRGYSMDNVAITYREDGRTHFLKAGSGRAGYDTASDSLVFNLRDGFIIISDSVQTISRLNFENYRFVFPVPFGRTGPRARTRISDMRTGALLSAGGIRERIEVQKRMVFSVMPLLFLLLGAGIGIKLKQQSRILHIGLGGGITLLFLQFVFLGETLSMKAGTPVYIWLPAALFAVLCGVFLK